VLREDHDRDHALAVEIAQQLVRCRRRKSSCGIAFTYPFRLSAPPCARLSPAHAHDFVGELAGLISVIDLRMPQVPEAIDSSNVSSSPLRGSRRADLVEREIETRQPFEAAFDAYMLAIVDRCPPGHEERSRPRVSPPPTSWSASCRS
jgi:hypothetical protein